jgi:hypothetical protein
MGTVKFIKRQKCLLSTFKHFYDDVILFFELHKTLFFEIHSTLFF